MRLIRLTDARREFGKREKDEKKKKQGVLD